MEYEIDKYYIINPDKYYFCINIQSLVKFDGNLLIVKLEHRFFEDGFIGKIVKQKIFGDELTNVKIELSGKDIIKEYQFTEYNVPFIYMDFKPFFNQKDT